MRQQRLKTEWRECKYCTHAIQIPSGAGWICNLKLMTIRPEMRVTFVAKEGTCFEAKPLKK